MTMQRTAPKSIDEYIAGFPVDVQALLQKVRLAIQAAAPDVQETIKYQMPTFILNGNLVFFAAFKKHIGFYGGSRADEQLNAALAPYAGEKGSLKFPFEQPIPLDLIDKVVRLRVQENLAKAEAKGKKKYG